MCDHAPIVSGSGRRLLNTLDSMDILFGRHPIEEALASRTRHFESVLALREGGSHLAPLVEALRKAGVRVRYADRIELTRMAGSDAHQGIVAVVRERRSLALEDLVRALPEKPLVLALDGIEDPQNFGALLRSAEAAGVDGVVAPERRSAPLSAAAIKASAGAAEHVRLARVVNLVRALGALKQAGLWCAGLDQRGEIDYDQYDLTAGCVLVLGREGAGLHDLTRRACDVVLRIPMAGRISSLNVSAAGAVVLFEAARQRRSGTPASTVGVPGEHAGRGGKPRRQKGLGSC